MNKMKSIVTAGLLLAFACATASAGEIQGIVRSVGNPSRVHIAINAEVTAYNHNTGQTFRTRTGTWIYAGGWYQGYQFNGLPNGTYTISVRYFNVNRGRWESGRRSRVCTLRRPQDRCAAAHVSVR
jgi:hypothetical protein